MFARGDTSFVNGRTFSNTVTTSVSEMFNVAFNKILFRAFGPLCAISIQPHTVKIYARDIINPISIDWATGAPLALPSFKLPRQHVSGISSKRDLSQTLNSDPAHNVVKYPKSRNLVTCSYSMVLNLHQTRATKRPSATIKTIERISSLTV